MRVFADTHYFIALLSSRDHSHSVATQWRPSPTVREIVTTSWVLVELLDSMGAPSEREIVANLVRRLQSDAMTRIVPLSEELMWRGFALFAQRKDKEWSLTDCISMIVMADDGITDVLTGDHHFEQAGFRALLKPSA